MKFEQEALPAERARSEQTSKDVVAAVALQTEEVQQPAATEQIGMHLHENEAFLLMGCRKVVIEL